jgi:hypothetical protein
MLLARRVMLVLLPLLFAACGQSDEELCKEANDKLRACGQPATTRCPEALADKVRDQYECIVDKECHELGDCAE